MLLEAMPTQRGYDLIPAQSVHHPDSTDPHVDAIVANIPGVLSC